MEFWQWPYPRFRMSQRLHPLEAENCLHGSIPLRCNFVSGYWVRRKKHCFVKNGLETRHIRCILTYKWRGVFTKQVKRWKKVICQHCRCRGVHLMESQPTKNGYNLPKKLLNCHWCALKGSEVLEKDIDSYSLATQILKEVKFTPIGAELIHFDHIWNII